MEKSGSISFFLKYWYLNFCTCSKYEVNITISKCMYIVQVHVICTCICKIYVQCKL